MEAPTKLELNTTLNRHNDQTYLVRRARSSEFKADRRNATSKIDKHGL